MNTTDRDHISKLIEVGTSDEGIAKAQGIAIKALKDIAGMSDDEANQLHNGCAATLSALLELSDIDVSMTLGAGHLAEKLGGTGVGAGLGTDSSRGWGRVTVGQQQAGDVGVCYDLTSPAGADHIYLVVERVDDDWMTIADNQAKTMHSRSAKGKGGKTPTEYFLRAPGYAPTPVAVVLSPLLTSHALGFAPASSLPLFHPAFALISVAPSAGVQQITDLAANSAIAAYHWAQRGKAPIGYIKGMAVAFARAYCNLKAGDAATQEMAKANTGGDTKDALSWMNQRFLQVGMSNGVSGIDTLRHLFVLLTGLGMRESSGRYCEGWDVSASKPPTASGAEAGSFQSSYDLVGSSALLPQLINKYTGSLDFSEIFREGVTPNEHDKNNAGTGPGLDFQILSKSCPAFAVEFAAVGLRNSRKTWGPINRMEAEIRTECDDMLKQIQQLVDNANICPV